MAKKTLNDPADYIFPLNINGLDGRMLRLPPPPSKTAKNREIMFVYGHHSSLERWWGLAQALNRYGAVTMPDLPGFGGMDSFYKIGKKPTIDNLADYLTAFVKLRYRRKKLIIVGMSFGFVIVTRMLQRNPELIKNVTLVISVVGFAHKDDFTFSKPRYFFYLFATKMILSHKLPALFFRYTAINTWVLRNFYGRTHNAKHKFKLASNKDEVEKIKDMEVRLWHDNDIRTWAFTSAEFLTFDNCRVQVDLPVWHVGAKVDIYFDHRLVDQHLQIIFSKFYSAIVDLETHAPSVIANEKDAAALIPPKLHSFLVRAK
ncbi:MAG TPA: alpha/beta hydrolase [Candidatus Saccharimonadales bacterium]|nr:alpha/beta hydrolase [Candidatus Saccharimonadales bacterium]